MYAQIILATCVKYLILISLMIITLVILTILMFKLKHCKKQAGKSKYERDFIKYFYFLSVLILMKGCTQGVMHAHE